MKYDKIVIAGRLFEIDAKNRMLVDVADKGNILLYEHMHSNKVSLDFVYDRETRRIALSAPISDVGKGGDTVSVRIPRGIAYQEYSEGNVKYVFNNVLSVDRGFYLLEELYRDRLAGVLPVMRIAGDFFEVDGKSGTVREELTGNPLQLEHAVKVEQADGIFYQGYYNEEHKNLIAVDMSATSLPKNTVWVEFPSLQRLDPVGAAIKDGKEPYAYLGGGSTRVYNALVVRIIESPLQAVVKENIVKKVESQFARKNRQQEQLLQNARQKRHGKQKKGRKRKM